MLYISGKPYHYLLLILFLIVFRNGGIGQIQSHPTGGNWSDPSTWVGGIVPTPDTGVIIGGPVFLDVNTECSSLYIWYNGLLRNHPGDSHSLTVFGSVTNDGYIGNNIFNLLLYIHGNIHQYGVWENFYTAMVSPFDQTLVFYAPFAGQYLVNSNTSGKIIASDVLDFQGTYIDMNNDTLYFLNEGGISMNGGFFEQIKVIFNPLAPNNSFVLNMVNGAVFQKSSFTSDNIWLQGTVQFQSAPITFNGMVINQGILQNFNNNNYTATINGSFINEGTIKNNIHKLSLSVSGNLHNQGNWNAWALNLTGTVDQDIYLDNPVSINQIIKSITGSKLIARTNLLLQNTSLNLMNDSLVFMEGNTLHLKNSSIQNLILRNINPGNNDPLNIIGENNATLIKAKILSDTIIIAGQVLIGNGPVIVQGTLINEGLIQNSGTNYFTLEVFGNLINEEIIKDNPSGFGLDLSLSGDFIQNGTIENRNTILAGATTQYLLLHKEFGGKFLLDNDPISGLQIDDKIVFNGTGIDLAGANLLLPDYSMLYIKQGYIKNCVVQSNIIDFALLENSWCENITLPEVKIFGDCQVKNDVVFLNNLELKGILQNHSDGDYSISIPGNFYNHGTVQNNINSLSISLEGDLFNNGTINIDELVLTGSYDQVIQLQNENNIDGILKFHTNNSLDFEWFKDGISLLSNPYYSGAQSDTLVFLNAVTDAYMGTYNCLTGSEWSRNIVIDTLSNLYLIDLKVFLQGPYNNGYMSNVLITSEQLPLTQPYNQYPWYFPGNENVSAVPNNDIVDWLFLKLKDSDQSGSANKSKVFDKIAVFVLNDGRVVGMDGISLIPFYRNITDSLYIEITHRNHLSIMSAYGLTLEEGIYSYDFSIDSLSAYGGLPSLSKLNTFPPFQYGMVSGDANNDGKVDVTDYESFWKPYAGSKVFYETKDLNFDGHINNQDKNDAWIKNNGKSSQVPQ